MVIRSVRYRQRKRCAAFMFEKFSPAARLRTVLSFDKSTVKVFHLFRISPRAGSEAAARIVAAHDETNSFGDIHCAIARRRSTIQAAHGAALVRSHEAAHVDADLQVEVTMDGIPIGVIREEGLACARPRGAIHVASWPRDEVLEVSAHIPPVRCIVAS